MLDKNVSDLELKIRIVKGEIREYKKKKEKCWENVLLIILAFISLVVISVYYFFIKKEKGLSEIILSVILLLISPVLGFYWYKRYKKASDKIEQLERELYLLEKSND